MYSRVRGDTETRAHPLILQLCMQTPSNIQSLLQNLQPKNPPIKTRKEFPTLCLIHCFFGLRKYIHTCIPNKKEPKLKTKVSKLNHSPRYTFYLTRRISSPKIHVTLSSILLKEKCRILYSIPSDYL